MAPATTGQSPARKRKPGNSKNEPFSDASSSYWPPGWNWARYSDPEVDFSTLSEEDKEKMRSGLQEVLGDDGMRKLSVYVRQKAREWEDKKLDEQGAPPPEYKAPDFLQRWQKTHQNENGSWGFVAFRTALYDNEEKWLAFKDRVRRILDVAFDRVVEQHRGHEYEQVAESRRLFKLHWVEDEQLDGATVHHLRERFTRVKMEEAMAMAAGVDYNMFLCASPEAVASVLSLDDDDLPTTTSLFWRDDAPFLLAVLEEAEVNAQDEDSDDRDDPNNDTNWYKPVFKVPVEIIPDELWQLVDRAYTPLARLTMNVKGSAELGGAMPESHGRHDPHGLSELWWGMAPSPQALERRRLLRGF